MAETVMEVEVIAVEVQVIVEVPSHDHCKPISGTRHCAY